MIDENYLEEIFKANYAGYGFNELLKVPDDSVSDDIKCLATSPYGNECFHLIEAAICLNIIEKSNSLQFLGFNGEALTEAAKKRVPKVYANSVKTLAGFGVLHGRLFSSCCVAQFPDVCVPKEEIEAFLEGNFREFRYIYLADRVSYYWLYRSLDHVNVYPHSSHYGRYSINSVIQFIRDALLHERPITPIEGLMELKGNLTARREMLASSTILTYKELNELQEAAYKMREILSNKVYFSAASRRTLFGENGQKFGFLQTDSNDEQCYMFGDGDEPELERLVSYVERTQRVSKNTKEDMLRRMDFAIDMVGRYIEQENNKQKK